MDVILTLALGAVVAGFVQGLSGFAFGLTAMAIWAWTVEPQLAAAMAVFGAFTGQLIAAVTVRRGFNLKLLLPFVTGGLLGVPLGVALLPHLDANLFKALLGGFLVIWCPFMLFARHLPPLDVQSRLADGLIGMIGGIMGGIGGFTGPIPTLWCTLKQLPKDTQRAVIQNFNLGMLTVALGVYLSKGLITVEMLPMIAVVAPAVIVTAMLGARMYIGISPMAFRNIVLTILTAAGVALLAAALPRLLG